VVSSATVSRCRAGSSAGPAIRSARTRGSLR
jgi:hypothetical protein